MPRPITREAVSDVMPLSQTVRIKDLALTVDGATGVGFGSVPVAGLPEGNILFVGAVAYIKLSTSSASVQDAFDGDYAIGTAATANADVSGTNEANIIPSTALGAATSKVSPLVRGVSVASLSGAIIDNTAKNTNLNLNVLIDDANISANGIAFLVNGSISISYIILGDD